MTSIQITHEKENPLFKRKEISGFLMVEKTPSREEITKVLSEKFSAAAENIKIKKIHGNFGTKKFSIEANIYSSNEEKNFTELKKKKDGAKK